MRRHEWLCLYREFGVHRGEDRGSALFGKVAIVAEQREEFAAGVIGRWRGGGNVARVPGGGIDQCLDPGPRVGHNQVARVNHHQFGAGAQIALFPVASEPVAARIRSAFGLPASRVIVTGDPRDDVLLVPDIAKDPRFAANPDLRASGLRDRMREAAGPG